MYPKGGEGERLLNPLISQRAEFCCYWDFHGNIARIYFTNPHQNITCDSLSARLNDGVVVLRINNQGVFNLVNLWGCHQLSIRHSLFQLENYIIIKEKNEKLCPGMA